MADAEGQAGECQTGPPLDVLTATGAELQTLMTEGKFRATDIVNLYLEQIEKHNHRGLNLNAMISTAPRDLLMRRAQELDEERAAGKIRGPLHGIPITLKDNICTDPELGMDTTCGSFALVGAKPKANAPLVDLLLKAGMIILGKANLSEMAGWKGFGVTVGWSALGGQTQSPYVVGGVVEGEKILGQSTPGGSSSGSAAGLAAGFAPLALATETDGSITQPANRAALYGIKATVGSLNTNGTAPWSSLTDSAGVMAKSAVDLATLLGIIMEDRYLSSTLTQSWEGQRIGFVDPTLWEFSPAICTPDPVLIAQQRAAMVTAISEMTQGGAEVKQPVPLTSMHELVLDGEDALDQLWNHDFAKAWDNFLKGFETSPVRSIADIVQFNKDNAYKELPEKYPGQQLLEGSLIDTMSDEKYAKGVEIIRTAARTNGIDRTLADYNLDVIMGPMDGRIPTIAAAAGYPVGTVPLGYSKTNGRPFGLCIIAGANQEKKILRAMSAWDATMPKRKAPPQLVHWEETDAGLGKL